MLERLMALLGLGKDSGDEEEYGEETLQPDLEEREDRVMKPAPVQADLIFLRGGTGLERKEELAEALRKGRMLLVDLRGMDRDSGQSLLDFLCGVAYASRGTVLRVAGGVFLAAPRKTMIEEWEEKNGG